MSSTPLLATHGAALRLEGADVLPLLHRISTQALAELAPGDARLALFCDFRGRLLYRAVVAHGPDGAVWLACPDAPPEPLAAFVDRHVFREDVRIADRTAGLAPRWVAGELAVGAVVWEHAAPERIGFAPGVEVRFPADDVPALGEAARVRLGLARHGHEIAEAFTPYEVGLAPAVHLNKGCWTGQEALMRLVTYDSVRRALALVAGTGAPPPVPAEALADDARAGVVTSAVADAERWVGLAVLAREAMARAARFTLAGGAPLTVTPFPEMRPQGRP